MNVVILSARTGWHTDELLRALAGRGHVGCVVPYEGLRARIGGADEAAELTSEGASIFHASAVLARIIPSGALEQIIYRVDALHWIEQHGVPVVNSARAIERSVDKFYTTALLREAGLPTPETIACERAVDAVAAIRDIGAVVIKPLFGSLGHGIVRVSDPDVAFRIIRSLEQARAVFYVQREVDHGGRDIRAFVVGGRVLGAIERLAPPGDWRTNMARGGTARPFSLPAEWAELAVRAAAAVGADYAGVDLLPSRTGDIFVLEVNAIPGWQGLQQATGQDVAAALVEILETKTRPTSAYHSAAGQSA